MRQSKKVLSLLLILALALSVLALPVLADLPPEPTPTAIFTATGYDTATLTYLEAGMKFRIDGGEWMNITGPNHYLNGLSGDVGAIEIYKPGDGVATTDSEAQTIKFSRFAAPVGLGSINCTTPANNDGTLTGLTANWHEYKESGAADWTTATADTVTGLSPGTYYVRQPARNTVLASDNVSLPIFAFVDPLPLYNIIAGANGKWVSGAATGLSVTCDGPCDEFLSLYIDGNPAPIAIENYTVTDGSTIITLKPEYLQTLSAGVHTLRMAFLEGYAEATFTILSKANTTGRRNPQTGVGSMGMTGFEMLSALSAAAVIFAGKRRKTDK